MGRRGADHGRGGGCLLPASGPDPVPPLLPSGVTFSFFWKTQGEQSRPTPTAYGGQVISDGFKVGSSGGKGSVELYTRDNSMTWEATFSPPGRGAVRWGGHPWGEAAGGRTLPVTGAGGAHSTGAHASPPRVRSPGHTTRRETGTPGGYSPMSTLLVGERVLTPEARDCRARWRGPWASRESPPAWVPRAG